MGEGLLARNKDNSKAAVSPKKERKKIHPHLDDN